MRVYLSGTFTDREWIKILGELVLKPYGVEIVSTWLDVSTPYDALSPEERAHLAITNFNDVWRSQTVVFFSHLLNGRGGAHVEFGLAVAMARTIVVVGEPYNLFHYLPSVVICPTIDRLPYYLGLERTHWPSMPFTPRAMGKDK